jgi:hypothetical protein
VLQRRRRPVKTANHRSGDSVLTSPRVIVDADGEFLYIPADRALIAREAALAAERAAAAERGEDVDDPAVEEEPAEELVDADLVIAQQAAAEELAAEAAARDAADREAAERLAVAWEAAEREDAERTAVAQKVAADLAADLAAAWELAAREKDARDALSRGLLSWDAPEASGGDVAGPASAGDAAARRAEYDALIAPEPMARTSQPAAADEPATAERAAAVQGVADEYAAEEVAADDAAGEWTTAEPLGETAREPESGEPEDDVRAAEPTDVPEPVDFAEDDAPVPAELQAPVAAAWAEHTARQDDLETAMTNSRTAARRRAVIMVLLFVLAAACWIVAATPAVPTWAAVPATGLLLLHALASRIAGLRSREQIIVMATQLHAAELAVTRAQRHMVTMSRAAEVAAEAARTPIPDRLTRRAEAVGADTWEPVPVPPPIYTRKPAHRPETAPAARPNRKAATPAAGVSRGALPRRAADIERILALESDLDEVFEPPKAVNG